MSRERRDNDKLERAKDALKNALALLETDETTQRSQPPINVDNCRRLQSASTSTTPSATDDFRRAFPGLCSRNVSRPSTSRAPSTLQPPAKKSRQMVGYTPVTFKVPDTWTHDVCILGRRDESVTPDRSRNETLTRAGLGRVRLVFPDRKASHRDLQNFLESKFPKMKAGGGFEVLRAHGGGGGQRSLIPLPPSKEGYPVPYLKERLNSAVAYIRPLQADLDEAIVVEVESGPMVPCIHCNKEIPFKEVKEHNCISDLATQNSTQDDLNNEDAIFVDGPSTSSCPRISSQRSSIEQASDAEQIEADLRLARRLEEEFNDDLEILNTTMSISSTSTSLAEELAIAALKSQSSKSIDLYVQRSRVLKNVFEELKGKQIETSKLSVEFVGEPAADTGGPTREMFTIAFQQAIDSRITRGSLPTMTFMHDQSALAEGEYKMFGQLVALALLNGACGPHFLLPSLIHFVLGTPDEQDVTSQIEQLPMENYEIKKKLQDLNSCDNLEQWNEAMSNFDERFDMGINSASVPFEKKEAILRAAVKHIMLSSVAEEIYSFQEGLSLFNVLTIMKKYPEQAFMELAHVELKEEDVRIPFTPILSVKGSTKRVCEEIIAYNFNQFLKKVRQGAITRTVLDIEEILSATSSIPEIVLTLNLNDILQFITGSRYIPPGGFKGSMLFEHDALEGSRAKANTCGRTITFPVNKRYNSEDSSVFTSNFADDIFDGPGYGCI